MTSQEPVRVTAQVADELLDLRKARVSNRAKLKVTHVGTRQVSREAHGARTRPKRSTRTSHLSSEDARTLVVGHTSIMGVDHNQVKHNGRDFCHDAAMETLAKRLKFAIEKRGLKARALSIQIGKSKNYVNQILAGKIDEPSWKATQALARELGVDARWLQTGSGDGPTNQPDLYPSRAPVVAFLRAREDVQAGVADALEGIRHAGGDPGEDWWWEKAEELIKRAKSMEAALGLGGPDARLG